jgi:AcrR family transcriptional regulator
MQRRADRVDDTRRRITEAAVGLHTTVGPSETSFAAVAEAAGVTRLTLYRHFSNRDELFAACMGHWRAQHPPPDVDGWRSERTFERRVRRALLELYAWYAENGAELYPLYRDAAFTPAATQEARRRNTEGMTDAILGSAEPSPRLRAAVNHVLAFWTWHSLAVDEGCSTEEAAELAAGFVFSARRRRRSRRPDEVPQRTSNE